MSYQEPLLRGAAQTFLLQALLHLVDPARCPHQELANMFLSMWQRGALLPGTEMWRKVAKFLREDVYHGEADRMYSMTFGDLTTLKRVQDRVSLLEGGVTKAVLMMALFLSGGDWKGEEVEPLVNFLIPDDEEPRAYSDERCGLTEEQEHRVELLALRALLQVLAKPGRRQGRGFLHFSAQLQEEQDPFTLLGLQEEQLNLLLRRLASSLLSCSHPSCGVEEVTRGRLYLDLLAKLAPKTGLDGEGVLKDMLSTLAPSLSSDSPAQRVLVLGVVGALARLEKVGGVRQAAVVELRRVLMGGGGFVRGLGEGREVSNREEGKEWGGLECGHRREQLLVLAELLEGGRELLGGREMELEQELMESLEIGGRECLVPALKLALVTGPWSEVFYDSALR